MEQTQPAQAQLSNIKRQNSQLMMKLQHSLSTVKLQATVKQMEVDNHSTSQKLQQMLLEKSELINQLMAQNEQYKTETSRKESTIKQLQKQVNNIQQNQSIQTASAQMMAENVQLKTELSALKAEMQKQSAVLDQQQQAAQKLKIALDKSNSERDYLFSKMQESSTTRRQTVSGNDQVQTLSRLQSAVTESKLAVYDRSQTEQLLREKVQIIKDMMRDRSANEQKLALLTKENEELRQRVANNWSIEYKQAAEMLQNQLKDARQQLAEEKQLTKELREEVERSSRLDPDSAKQVLEETQQELRRLQKKMAVNERTQLMAQLQETPKRK